MHVINVCIFMRVFRPSVRGLLRPFLSCAFFPLIFIHLFIDSFIWSQARVVFCAQAVYGRHNRASYYIFVLWFLLASSFISSPILSRQIGSWMFTILPHTVWPYCEFRMQVWNVLHAARCKYKTQKNAKKFAIYAPSHNLSGCIFATKARSDNRKKTVKQ